MNNLRNVKFNGGIYFVDDKNRIAVPFNKITSAIYPRWGYISMIKTLKNYGTECFYNHLKQHGALTLEVINQYFREMY